MASAQAQPIEFPVGGITEGDIRLRMRQEADVAGFVAICRDPEVPRWTRVADDYDEAAERSFSERAERDRLEGRALRLLVVDCEDDTLLGSCSIVALSGDEGRCEVGYLIAKQTRDRGVATRAVRLLCGWIFDNLPVDRIEIQSEPENAASCRVAERAGFTREGVLRSYYENKGRRRNVVMYSLLRNESMPSDRAPSELR